MSNCDSPGNAKSLIPVNSAIGRLLASDEAQPKTESVDLIGALGRVLAEDQRSPVNVPAFDNSAMDGYAVHLDSLQSTNKLQMSQRIIAGDSVNNTLTAGSCARIFTGAPIPKNANAVVMQEDCQVLDEAGQQFIVFPEDINLYQNIRPLGQDIEIDKCVLRQGTKLRSQELGLLASIGIDSVAVYQKLKVAVISTGNELVEPGQALQSGQIYNSNRYTMIGMLQALGFEIIDYGTVKDDAELIKETLLLASEQADCILTSGGVSVGEEDHVKNIVEEVGQLDLWKVAIKPGKPLAFGHINNTPFIGLPGNPSAVFVTFNIIAKPFLQKMQGISDKHQSPILVQADFEVNKPSVREQYLLVKAVQKPDGKTWLVKYPNQSSGVLSSTSWANGFAKIPVKQTVAIGDLVEFINF